MKIALKLLITIVIIFITTLLIAGFLFLYSHQSPVHEKKTSMEYNSGNG